MNAVAAELAHDDRLLLRTQAQAALEDVTQAQAMLERGRLDPALAERVELHFLDALHRQQLALVAIEHAIEAGAPTDQCWRQLVDARDAGRGLLAECLAYLHAGLGRSGGIAAELCRLADRLLDDVSRRTSVPWERFTTLASGELIGEQARIVRLPFPDASVWTLPIALHELGHHVVPQLGRTPLDGTAERPFADLLAAVEAEAVAEHPLLGERARRQFLELLADAFAAHAGGPAFALACAYLRFDPRHLPAGDRLHPGDGVRMHAILRGLELADAGRGALGDFVPRLRATWEDGVVAAGGVLPAPDAAFDERIDRVHALLDEHAYAARFDGWLRAQLLADALADDVPAPQPLPGLRPWDVVNAGWIARTRLDPDPYALRRLAERTEQACWAALS